MTPDTYRHLKLQLHSAFWSFIQVAFLSESSSLGRKTSSLLDVRRSDVRCVVLSLWKTSLWSINEWAPWVSVCCAAAESERCVVSQELPRVGGGLDEAARPGRRWQVRWLASSGSNTTGEERRYRPSFISVNFNWDTCSSLLWWPCFLSSLYMLTSFYS